MHVMRLSTRLLRNAVANYARMGATFAFGVFFIWYAVGKIGMVGLGMIGLTTATFGISGAVELAMQGSLVREMAAAIASDKTARVRKSLTSAMVLCVPIAGLLATISVVLAVLAYLNVFRVPEGAPALSHALAILLLAEGAHTGIRLLFAPYTQALFAGQHLGLDNFLIGLAGTTNGISAVVVFGLLYPNAPLDTQLIGFAAMRAVLHILLVGLGVCLAKARVTGLKLDLHAFDRTEFCSILGTVWHTGQVTLLMSLNLQFMAILINFFFGITYNGIWQIVVQLGGYMRMLSLGLLRGIDPLSTHLLEKGERTAIVGLMMRSIRYQLASLLPAASLMIIFMHPILKLWVGDRIFGDGHLKATGLTESQAISMIAQMAYIIFAAQVVRGSMFGIERMLYGMGEVRAYSWFAKYAAVLSVSLAAGLMWLIESPVVAPAPILLVYLIFYYGVILRAAALRVGLPIVHTLARSVPRPLLASVLLCMPLLWAKNQLGEVTLLLLAIVTVGAVIMFGFLIFAIVFEADERARITQIFMVRLHRVPMMLDQSPPEPRRAAKPSRTQKDAGGYRTTTSTDDHMS